MRQRNHSEPRLSRSGPIPNRDRKGAVSFTTVPTYVEIKKLAGRGNEIRFTVNAARKDQGGGTKDERPWCLLPSPRGGPHPTVVHRRLNLRDGVESGVASYAFYSWRRASIGSSLAAEIAGYMPKNTPTRTESPKLTPTAQG